MRFTSHDEHEISDFITRTYVSNGVRLARQSPSITFDAVRAERDEISAGLVRSGVEYSVAAEPSGYFHAIGLDSGRIQVDWADVSVGLGPGDALLCPVDVALELEVLAVQARGIRLPTAAFDRVAAEMADLAGGTLRFTGAEPVSATARTYWRAVMGLVGGALLAPDSPFEHELVAAEMLRLAVVSALHTFPNTTMERPRTGPGPVSPAALRRAVAMIEEHAGRPISLGDIAAATGTSSRALQYAFRRHLATTPMAYLRQVRLDQAHRDLQAADPTRGDTVRQVALRWGFAHAGRFAAAYREAYGVPPSRTLDL